jgi:hypothetical protein
MQTMDGMPECKPCTGMGAGNALIEEIADIGLALEKQNGWLCWSILMSLEMEGLIEVVPGTEKRRRWRLT